MSEDNYSATCDGRVFTVRRAPDSILEGYVEPELSRLDRAALLQAETEVDDD